MRVLSVLVVCAAAFVTAEEARLHSEDHYTSLFNHWKKAHDFSFKCDKQEAKALRAFAANSDLIEEHNAAYKLGKHTYTLGHNEFSHLTWEEFRAQKLGLKPRKDRTSREHGNVSALRSARLATTDFAELPKSVDWVEKGAVTSVKNQGMCGSCWAFSAVGALEGAYAIATGKLIDLSEEQMLDCDKKDSGCGGGEMETAFEWVEANGGMCLADDYPYTGILPPFKTCKTSCTNVPGTAVSGWIKADADEKSVMAAVAKGPLSVGIQADQLAFQLYRDGVFSAPCGTDLDHGVVLVGYGTDEETDLPYWKVKNSWGASWGKDGYILLARPSPSSPPEAADDAGGECGILMDATYPVLASSVAPVVPAVAVVAAAVAKPAVEVAVAPVSEAAVLYEEEDTQPQQGVVEFDAAVPAYDAAESALLRLALSLWRGPYGAAAASDCTGGGSTIVFQDISIEPETPARGKPVKMAARGVLTKPITSGKYSLNVSLAGMTVYSHNGDVCGESKADLPLGLGHIALHGLACPSPPGEVHYGLDVHLPSIAPPGAYTIELSAVDQDSTDLMCLHADIKL